MSTFERQAIERLHKEDLGGLKQFVHDYLGSPAGVFVCPMENWHQVYTYIFMHVHLISDKDLAEYCDD